MKKDNRKGKETRGLIDLFHFSSDWQFVEFLLIVVNQSISQSTESPKIENRTEESSTLIMLHFINIK